MGKGRRNKGNKRNNKKKPDDNKNETFTRNRKEINEDGQNVAENDCTGSVNNIQGKKSSKKAMELHEKERKYGNKSTETIQNKITISNSSAKATLYSRKDDSDDYTLKEFLKNAKASLALEYLKIDKDMKGPGITQSKLNDLKKFLDLIISKKEEVVRKLEKPEELQQSKEKANSIKYAKMNGNKSNSFSKGSFRCDSSSDFNELAGRSLKNSTESKKGFDESTDKIQNFYADKEIKESNKKYNMDAALHIEKNKISQVSVFNMFTKEFNLLEGSQLQKQFKKSRESISLVEIEKLNFSSTKKGYVRDDEDIETRDIPRVPLNRDDENIEETNSASDDEHDETVSSNLDDENTEETNSASDDEHDETVSSNLDDENTEEETNSESDDSWWFTDTFVELDKSEEIDVVFEINGDKHVSAGDYYFDSCEKEADMTFNYKDQNIQVSFIDNEILISTQNSEFNISVRNSNPTDLIEDAPKADSFP